jgi:hypothetical protein
VKCRDNYPLGQLSSELGTSIDDILNILATKAGLSPVTVLHIFELKRQGLSTKQIRDLRIAYKALRTFYLRYLLRLS